MFKTRYYTKCCSRISFLWSRNHLYIVGFFFAILLFGSCQNPVNKNRGKKIVENIISDTRLIQIQYELCMNEISTVGITLDNCKDGIISIKKLHKKSVLNLSSLSKLRDKKIISNDTYDVYIEKLDKEFKKIRILHEKIEKEGVSFDL